MTNTRRQQTVSWVLGLALVFLWVGPALYSHARNSADPGLYANDSRIYIFSLFRFSGSPQFQNDHVSTYVSAITPPSLIGLYWLGAKCGIDPATTSKILPYVTLGLTAAAMGIAAHHLGGKLAALLAVLFVLGSNAYLIRMAGGLPRAFGHPFIAAAIVALVYGREKVLAGVVILAAMFYPVAGMISGMFLALLLWLSPSSRRTSQRLTFLICVGALASLPLIALLIRTRPFGATITPADLPTFPESGPGGRYASYDVVGSGNFLELLTGGLSSLLPWPAPYYIQFFVLAAAFAIFLYQAKKQPAALRVLLAFAIVPIGFCLAKLAAPFFYIPERYITYPLPVFVHLYLACAVAFVATRIAQSARGAWVPAVLLVGGVIFLFGGRVSARAGLNGSAKTNQTLLKVIADLPPESVIAGWPGRMIDDVPYVARKRVLLSYETHQVMNKKYIMEMRRRANALFAAYFATDFTPLLRLHEKYGVTHLIFDMDDWRDVSRPGYFLPFNHKINELKRLTKGKSPAISACLQTALVARQGASVALFDLSKVQACAVTSRSSSKLDAL